MLEIFHPIGQRPGVLLLKRSRFILALFLVVGLMPWVLQSARPAAAAPTYITVWTFEGEVSTPATGTGTALAGTGLSGETFPVGNGSGAAWSFTSWSTGELDANDYFEFDVSTVGYADIKISFGERRSNTGIRNFEVQYSTDGTTFTQFAPSATNVPDDANWRTHTYDLSSIAALNDNANARFRIYGYLAESAAGTWRIDDVTIFSEPPIPTLSVSPTTLVYTATEGGADPATQTISVSNTGTGGLLDWSLSDDAAWLDCLPNTGIGLAAGSSTTVTCSATTGTLTVADSPYTRTITVTTSTPGAVGSPQPVGVTFTILPLIIPPTLTVTPATLTYTANQNGANPAAQQIIIGNFAGAIGPLDWSLSDNAAWLDCLPNAGTGLAAGTTTTVDCTATTGDLTSTDSPYTGTITVISSTPDVSGSPQNVGATFNINPGCGSPTTTIPAVQGSGTASPIVGNVVTVEGVVVGDFQGAGLSGFFIQDPTGDSDPATSDGIFVYDTAFAVNPGDAVRVTGTVSEYNNLTELSGITDPIWCETGTIAATTINLPFASSTDAERYEGMLVTFPQTLTVTETYELGRYGQVVLSSNGRLWNPTNVVSPGAPAIAMQAANDLNRIYLDDAKTSQNPDPTPYIFGEPTLRSGYTVDNLTGILSQSTQGTVGTYRIQPTAAPPFVASNPRTAAPPVVSGSLHVTAMNTLNFFNGDGLGGGFPAARGATTYAEYLRQREKLATAIIAMDSDVIGLMEIENDAPGNSAVEDLVTTLNATAGAGTYDFVNTDVLGTDQIRVAIIYQPASVTPVGSYLTDTDPVFSRPPLAQIFRQNSSGEVFAVVVNHFKSKGCPGTGGDADQGDGQACFNATRVAQANQLLTFINSVVISTSGDPDVLIVGDLNAYAKEDPITVLTNGGYVNLIAAYIADAYSYVYSAQSGYLDHSLASASLAGTQIAGVAEWHINSDEPTVLDYNMEYKSAAQQALNVGTPYRTSDHDPVIIGLNLLSPTLTVSPTTLTFSAVEGGADPATQQITIGNIAGASGALDWSLSDDAAWLDCTPNSGTGLAAGATTPATCTATTGALTAAGSPYTAIITITSATLGVSGSPRTVDVTFNITNDEVLPVLGIDDVTVFEPGSGNGRAVFTVHLSEPGELPVTVGYASSDDTATTPDDYEEVVGILTFAPGVTRQKVTVTIFSDAVTEGAETFFLNLNLPTNATIGDDQAIGTIDDTVPTLRAPANASQISDNTPTLRWNALPNATHYRLQVDNNRNFSSPVVNTVLTGTRYTLTTTLTDQTYYWRVQARDVLRNWGGWSSRWSFTVETTPLAAPVQLGPGNGSTVTTNRPVFRWQAVAGAAKYTLQVDNQSTFASPVINETLTTTRYRSTDTLAAGTYFWRVRAQNAAGRRSSWSSTWRFTIAGAAVLPLTPAAVTNTPTLVPTMISTATPTPTAVIVPPTDVVTDPLLRIESTDPVVGQTGSWTAHLTEVASGGSYLYSSGSFDDVLSLGFMGTQIEVVYIKHPALGTFAVEIDGTVMQIVNSVASDSEFGAIAVVSGLVDGPHTLRIYPVAGVVALDAFGVEALADVTVPTPVPTDLPPEQPTLVPTDVPPDQPTVMPSATSTPLPVTLPLIETFDSGLNWQPIGTWAFDTQNAYRGAGWFANSTTRGQISTLTFGAQIDLRTALNPMLSFWYKSALSSSDLVAVDVSLDGGLSWLPVDQQIGQVSDWTQRTLDLTAYRGSVLSLRFRLDTANVLPDGTLTTGIGVDDLLVQDTVSTPTDVPTIEPSLTDVPTATPVPPTATDIPTDTPMPTDIPTGTLVPTETPLPSATLTDTPSEISDPATTEEPAS